MEDPLERRVSSRFLPMQWSCHYFSRLIEEYISLNSLLCLHRSWSTWSSPLTAAHNPWLPLRSSVRPWYAILPSNVGRGRASLQQCKEAHYPWEKPAGRGHYRGLRMPEGVVEKQPDRAAIWTFQEAEVVGGSEVISFNSRVNGKVNTLQQWDRNLYITQSNIFILFYINFWC